MRVDTASRALQNRATTGDLLRAGPPRHLRHPDVPEPILIAAGALAGLLIFWARG